MFSVCSLTFNVLILIVFLFSDLKHIIVLFSSLSFCNSYSACHFFLLLFFPFSCTKALTEGLTCQAVLYHWPPTSALTAAISFSQVFKKYFSLCPWFFLVSQYIYISTYWCIHILTTLYIIHRHLIYKCIQRVHPRISTKWIKNTGKKIGSVQSM